MTVECTSQPLSWKLAERQFCGLIGGCADGQGDQYFVRMEPWVAAAKIAGF